MPRDLTQPPAWCPTAVATDRGWEDPKTGELLVSLRQLKSIIESAEKEAEEEKPARRKTKKKSTRGKADETEQKVEAPVGEPEDDTVLPDPDLPSEETSDPEE